MTDVCWETQYNVGGIRRKEGRELKLKKPHADEHYREKHLAIWFLRELHFTRISDISHQKNQNNN